MRIGKALGSDMLNETHRRRRNERKMEMEHVSVHFRLLSLRYSC